MRVKHFNDTYHNEAIVGKIGITGKNGQTDSCSDSPAHTCTKEPDKTNQKGPAVNIRPSPLFLFSDEVNFDLVTEYPNPKELF